jgi:predicted nucleotidyltransferase
MKTVISQQLDVICRRFGVQALWSFGSRGSDIAEFVRGRAARPGRNGSDVDLGVLYSQGTATDAQARVRLADELEMVFNAGRVDLVVIRDATPFLAVEIVGGELLVDTAPRETAEYELYVLRRAADLLPFHRARIEAVLGEGAR